MSLTICCSDCTWKPFFSNHSITVWRSMWWALVRSPYSLHNWHDKYIISIGVRLYFMRNCDKIQYKRCRIVGWWENDRKKIVTERDGEKRQSMQRQNEWIMIYQLFKEFLLSVDFVHEHSQCHVWKLHCECRKNLACVYHSHISSDEEKKKNLTLTWPIMIRVSFLLWFVDTFIFFLFGKKFRVQKWWQWNVVKAALQ